MATDLAIEVQGLRKSYGSHEAVRGIDLRVSRGEVFALLGPNGAGKTTAVEILEGHRKRTSGEVNVLGFDPNRGERAYKERIGIVLQETGVDPYLSVAETIELYRGYYPKPRPVDEVLTLVGLNDQRDQRVLRLSGGQQRRLDVAIGIAGDPDLIFLDEPTTGFDPAARHEAWDMVKGLQALGKTVFLTTHYMDEAEYLADRVALIRRGEIVVEGPPHQLIDNDPLTTIRFHLPSGNASLVNGLDGARIENGAVVIETRKPTDILFELTSRAHKDGIELEELSVNKPNLEALYLRLVSEPNGEGGK